VLLPQLAKLDERNRRRAAAVSFLSTALKDAPGLTPFVNPPDLGQPAYYKQGFQFDEALFELSRAAFIAAVRAEGMALDEGFPAAQVGRSPRRFRTGSALAEAERAHRGCVVLHHPVLLGSDADLAQIAQAVRKVYQYRDALRGRDAG
jgi:3-amino-5-hydroxybenzoate synthase